MRIIKKKEGTAMEYIQIFISVFTLKEHLVYKVECVSVPNDAACFKKIITEHACTLLPF